MKRLTIPALLLILTAACGPQTFSPSPTVPPVTSPTLPAAAPGLGPVCLPEQEGVTLSFENFENAATDILTYLNAGGEITALNTDYLRAETGDLSGDGRHDIIVAVLDPNSAAVPPRGTLFIYHCQDGQYVLAFDLAPVSSDYGAPVIHFVQDMNADGKVEAVVSTSTCGAHTCFLQVQILGWDGTGYVNLLEGASDDLPYSGVDVRAAGDGTFALDVIGTGFGSVGAGPYRVRTRTWTYDPPSGHWKVSGETLEPPRYRIHALHDADAAFRAGDYATAEALYLRVINDAALLAWADPPIEQANLGAYARFKLVVLYTQTGRQAEAEAMLNQLRAGPPVSHWRDYTELAEIYMQGVAIAGLGCPTARDYAANHPDQILLPLGSFGYANPDYNPEDICP